MEEQKKDTFDIYIGDECIAKDVDLDVAPNFLMTLAMKYKPQLVETGAKVSLSFHRDPEIVKENVNA